MEILVVVLAILVLDVAAQLYGERIIPALSRATASA